MCGTQFTLKLKRLGWVDHSGIRSLGIVSFLYRGLWPVQETSWRHELMKDEVKRKECMLIV